jgi:hypothetical protein
VARAGHPLAHKQKLGIADLRGYPWVLSRPGAPLRDIVNKKPDRHAKKSYAMRRMTLALERAIKRPTSKEKERAARWAAVWGLLCGIRTEGVNLKACDIQTLERRIEQGSDSSITLVSSSLIGVDSAVQPQYLPKTSSPLPAPAHTIAELPSHPFNQSPV